MTLRIEFQRAVVGRDDESEISIGKLKVLHATVPGMNFVLRRGATPQQALGALDEALGRLVNARSGGHTVNYGHPTSHFLETVPEVEVVLGNGFDRRWVTDQLHTPRFWALLQAPGANGPINASAANELQMQIELLEAMKPDLKELDDFASTPGRILIVDTNTLIHYQPLDKIRWRRNGAVAGETLRVLVPLAVADELDGKAHNVNPKLKERARNAVASLHALLGDSGSNAAASFITDDGTSLSLEIPRDDLGRIRASVTDDEIRDYGAFVQQVTGRTVTVVTQDIGLKTRCRHAGLAVLTLDPKDGKDQPAT